MSTTPTHEDPPASAQSCPEAGDVLTRVDDFQRPQGWADSTQAQPRARQCCEQLEAGRILFLERSPFAPTAADGESLLTWRKAGSRKADHVSYHPADRPPDGAVGSKAAGRRVHGIMRQYSSEVTRTAGWLLAPYAMDWVLEPASLRLKPETGRAHPARERNDLLHLEGFSTRPTRGRRLLRCYTNISPVEPVVWATADSFETLAQKYAAQAGLGRIAAQGSRRTHPLVRELKSILGMKTVDLTAYDRFMVRFQQHLKEQKDWQENSKKIRLEFPPGSSWIFFADAVPHAELSAAGTLEQSFTIPLRVAFHPERAPIRVLEGIAGLPLANFSS
jgi:hypothetical protein